MNIIDEKIKDIARETIQNNGFLLIDIIFRGLPKKRIIEIYIDGTRDISADDCALVSREINEKLEAVIEYSYRLDVSSPGVDRPLKFLEQYPKHINRKFEVSYTDNEETKKIVGKLVSVNGEDLTFSFNHAEKIINFNNIKKAKVLISFS